jgi:hypothetical protein
LPGFDQPPPSAIYSGYVEYPLQDRTIRTHYVLVRAEREEREGCGEEQREEGSSPPRKPLIYWSNGGPGASSLFGLLTELGPLQLSDGSLATPQYRSTGIPTLLYTPYAWTRLGSVLVFDQPAPVGFSYCVNGGAEANDTNGGADKSCDGVHWTDELAAENTYRALQAFYDKFPCYNSTSLFLTGESYAGIYIPTLARRILTANSARSGSGQDLEDDRHNLRSLLRGVAVGDGCLGTQTGICGEVTPQSHRPDLWRVLFLAGHGQIPFATFHEVLSACRAFQDQSLLASTEWATGEPDCQAALAKVTEQVGGYYEYSLYDDCIYRNLGLSPASRLRGGLNDYPCGGYPVMVEWLNRADV